MGIVGKNALGEQSFASHAAPDRSHQGRARDRHPLRVCFLSASLHRERCLLAIFMCGLKVARQICIVGQTVVSSRVVSAIRRPAGSISPVFTFLSSGSRFRHRSSIRAISFGGFVRLYQRDWASQSEPWYFIDELSVAGRLECVDSIRLDVSYYKQSTYIICRRETSRYSFTAFG